MNEPVEQYVASAQATQRRELELVRAELNQHYATKNDLTELKAALSKDSSNNLKWMIAFQLLGYSAVAAIMRFAA